MTTPSSVLRDALEGVRGYEVELLETLVAEPSITGRPSGIIDLLDPLLTDLGLRVERIPVDPESWCEQTEFSPPADVIGEPPEVLHAVDSSGDRGDREVLIFAHTDTEPVHPGWEQDPYQLEVRDGRASGLGAADDKAGVVSVLAALRALRTAGVTPTRRARVVLGAGKQGGSLGTLQGCAAAAGVDAAIYSHPAESGAGLGQLKVASRGILTLRLGVTGRRPDPVEIRTPVSADPRTGHNAATRLARLVTSIERWNVDDKTVFAVTGIHCSTTAFAVPDQAEAQVACWFTDGTVSDVVDAVARGLAELVADDWERSHPPLLSVVGTRANPASCAGSAFAGRAAATIGEVTGEPVRDYRWHSASDIRFPMRLLGVPAVGFGARAGDFYGPGEWVDLASMHDATRAIAMLLTDTDR